MNNLKITLLLSTLTGILIGFGYYFGGQSGAFFAFIISLLMNFTSYWFSHKIVLSMYKAKEMTKEEHPKVFGMLEELSSNANLPLPKLYLIDLPVPNAFATGRNEKNSVVALSSAIMALLSDSELRGVIAHELSHIKNKDILISTISATLAGTISYIAQMFYFGGGNRERGGNIFVAIAVAIITPIIASILRFAISRSREYLADETGAKIANDSSGLANALRKLHNYSQNNQLIPESKHEATAHMFIVNPFKPSFLMSAFSTHPPMDERVRRLENMNLNN